MYGKDPTTKIAIGVVVVGILLFALSYALNFLQETRLMLESPEEHSKLIFYRELNETTVTKIDENTVIFSRPVDKYCVFLNCYDGAGEVQDALLRLANEYAKYNNLRIEELSFVGEGALKVKFAPALSEVMR